MSDEAAAPEVAAPVKTPKKKSNKPKKPSNHPKYSQMIHEALANLNERGGSSRQALLKYIVANFDVGKDVKTANNHLKLALRAGVKNGSLKQSKGTGASGSFRLGDKADKAAKTMTKKVKKPKTEKPKSTTPKVKKPKTKKASSKKSKSPSKKKEKKPKSPAKKVAKPKKKAAKKPAAKKASKKTAKN